MTDMLKKALAIAALAPFALLFAQDDTAGTYEVRVTNLTRGQRFTPLFVVSHDSSVSLFALGAPASAQLKALAEEGNFGPFAELLSANPAVCGVANSPTPPPASRLIAPGSTVTVNVEGGGKCDRISVAAMLIPTNDGFMAANSAEIPKGKETVVVLSPVYDAGTERNDEMCASIPGPGFMECITPSNASGDGGGASVNEGEGNVTIHAGIHGIGNMNASMRDWRNPAARIAIRRVK
ncbi:MAG: spondin domain-containing protein [Bryobacteraceae bacterium]